MCSGAHLPPIYNLHCLCMNKFKCISLLNSSFDDIHNIYNSSVAICTLEYVHILSILICVVCSVCISLPLTPPYVTSQYSMIGSIMDL